MFRHNQLSHIVGDIPLYIYTMHRNIIAWGMLERYGWQVLTRDKEAKTVVEMDADVWVDMIDFRIFDQGPIDSYTMLYIN